MNSGRSFGRHVMSSSVSHVADDRAATTFTAGEISALTKCSGTFMWILRFSSTRWKSTCRISLRNGCICTSRSSTLRAPRRRASSSGSTRGTLRCAARGRARCGRARSAAALRCRRRRCRAPCRRGACGGSRRGLRSSRGNAVNSNCMVRLLMSAAFRVSASGRPRSALRLATGRPRVARHARARGLSRAGKPSNVTATGLGRSLAATRGPCTGSARYSVNSELTDSSLETRVIVSASSCAHESWRMRGHACASVGQRNRVGDDDLVQLGVGDALRPRRPTAPGACSTRRPSSRRAPSAPWPPCTACSRCRRCRP